MTTPSTTPIIQFHPEFLSKYDNFIFDMDGVIWKSHIFLPGVVDTLNALQEQHNKRIFFCTNNSTQYKATYFEHFKHAGLRVPDNILYSSASTAASFVFHSVFDGIVPTNPTPQVLVIGQPGLHKEFHDYGLGNNIVSLANLRNDHTKGLHDLKHYEVPKEIVCVCAGLQTDFAWTDCAIATMIIRENKAEFLATNADVTFPSSAGRLLPGAGSVVNMIKGSCGKDPKIMGKPTQFMLKAIQNEHDKVDLTRTLMIGDRLDTDIAFGNNFGMDTLLVLSGVTDGEDYKASVGGWKIPAPFNINNDVVSAAATPIQINDSDNSQQSDVDEVPSPIPQPVHIPSLSQDPRPTYIANGINDLIHVGALLM